MKTRLSALAVAISSISVLTACGGGGPGSFTSDAPPPATPAPTVTVTAPATAAAGVAFDVAWTSTSTTSCTADFDSGTGAAGTASKTEVVPGTAAVTKTYTVTCTGAGGSATDSKSVVVSPNASAQGAWQGTTGLGRNLSGVVTDAATYWLTYTSTDKSKPAGFYTGLGKSAGGKFPSSNLREFNFEGGGAKQGTLSDTTTYTESVGYTNANALNGTVNANAGQAITASTNTYFAAAGGPLVMDLAGTYDATAMIHDPVLDADVHGVATMSGTVAIPGFSTSIHYNAIQFTMDPASGTGRINEPDSSAANCSANTGSGCAGFSQALAFPLYNAINFATTTSKAGTFDDSTATPFTPAAGAYTWTGIANVPVNAKNTVVQLPLDITLTGSSLPVVTVDTFSTHYDSSYEVTPSLATITGDSAAGTYAASPYTGIGSTLYNTGTTFSISSSGAISGTEPTSGCSYTGTIALHAVNNVQTGNVYDVTALTFTGGSCPYTATPVDTFTGAATYDSAAKKLTLTAVNGNRDKGFLVVVTKP